MREWRHSSTFINLGTRRAEWSASGPCAPATYWTGALVRSRAGLDVMVKAKVNLSM
jgi:hypothetical protein